MPRLKRSVVKNPVIISSVAQSSSSNYVLHSMPKTGWQEPRRDCEFAFSAAFDNAVLF